MPRCDAGRYRLGFGDSVTTARLDGKRVERPELAGSLTGTHTVELAMNGRWPTADVNEVDNRFAPATPKATRTANTYSWTPVPHAVKYVLYRNGVAEAATPRTTTAITSTNYLVEYQVLAVNAAGDESFLSEPIRVIRAGGEQAVKPESAHLALAREHTGYTGTGYLRLTRDSNISVATPVRIFHDGLYAVDVRYANGNGPVNTEDKVAVRTLIIDGDTAGVLVMPQGGTQSWSNWRWSNALRGVAPGHAHVHHRLYAAR